MTRRTLSESKSLRILRQGWSRGGAFALACAATGGCLGGGEVDGPASARRGPVAPNQLSPDLTVSWGVRAYIGDGATRVAIDLKPDDGAERRAGMGMLGKTPASARVGRPGRTLQDNNIGVPSQANVQSALMVLIPAAAECGVGDPLGDNPALTQHVAVTPTWADGGFAMFPNAPTTCDEMLAQAEAMLCTAGQILRASEAVAPTQWNAVGRIPAAGVAGATIPPDFLPGTWTIPPVAEENKFILRDVAMHLLANVAVADMTRPSAGTDGATCSELYARAAGGDTSSDLVAALFTAPMGATPAHFPPAVPLAAESLVATAKARLQVEAHVLRAGVRMLRTLTNASIASDVSQAQVRSSHAVDDVGGNRAAWGLVAEDSPKYNTLTHATKVAAGRLEMGAARPDPQRNGVVASDALRANYGVDLVARAELPAISSPAQEHAVRIVGRSGVVLPSTTVDDQSQDVRALLKEQMLGAAAAVHGLTADDPAFATGMEAQALSSVLDKITDADLRFALRRNNAFFRMRYDVPEVGPVVMDLGTGFSASGVQAAGGVVVTDGIAAANTCRLATVKMAPVSAAAQCGETGSAYDSLNPDNTVNEAFQNVPGLGQTYYRRLVKLREQTRAAGITDETFSTALQASVEARAWAGSKRITAFASDIRGEQSLTVRLAGFEAREISGLFDSPPSAELVLVQGPAWVGECSARVRRDCPSGFSESYESPALAVSMLSDGTDQATKLSLATDGAVVDAQFSATLPPAADGLNPLVLVLRPTAGGTGVAIGGFPNPPPNGSARTEAIFPSPLHTNTGTTTCPAPGPEHVGASSTGAPTTSCLIGTNSTYIPLENELTGDGDPFESSWKHYLTQATVAASKADELGRHLIDVGLQQDLRREGAGESLAQVCGDYSQISDVVIDGSGHVTGKTDAETVCFQEPTYDVTILTRLPSKDFDGNDQRRAFLSQILDCAGLGAANNLCPRLALSSTTVATTAPPGTPDPGTIYLGHLDLADFTGIIAPVNKECDDIASVTANFTNPSSQVLVAAASRPWATIRSARAGIAGAQLVRDAASGNWSVTYLGHTIMSSEVGTAWPGCLRSQSSQCDGNAGLFGELFMASGVRRDASCDPATERASGGRCLSRYFDGAVASLEFGRFLWRVEGALWMVGGMGGRIPANTFVVPSPAVDFASEPGFRAPYPTVFGTGTFTPFNPNTLDSSTTDSHETSPFLARAFDNQAAGGVVIPAPEAPEWLGQVENDSTHYRRHAPFDLVGKPEGYVGTKWSGWFVPFNSTKPIPIPDEDDVALNMFLTKAFQDMAGLSCSNFFGGTGHNVLQQRALALKDSDATGYTMYPYNPSQYAVNCNIAFGRGPGDTGASIDAFVKNLTGGPNTAPAVYSDMYADMGTGVFGLGSAAVANENPPSSESAAQCDVGAVHWVQLASQWPASQRAIYFINGGLYAPNGPCGAAAQMTQAMGLLCHFSLDAVTSGGAVPPQINSLDDLGGIESWLAAEGLSLQQALSKLALRRIPSRVVSDFQTGGVGSGSIKGAKGAAILQSEQAIQDIYKNWLAVTQQLDVVRAQIKATRAALANAKIEQDIVQKKLAIDALKVHQSICSSMSSGFASMLKIGAAVALSEGADVQADVAAAQALSVAAEGASMGGAAAGVAFGIEELNELDSLKQLETAQGGAQVAIILNDLNKNTSGAYAGLLTAMSNVRVAVGSALQANERISEAENLAKYEAAKGSGANFVSIDGKTVTLPVNAVLNYDYDLTRQRYDDALKNARLLSCMARLSIEERLGVRLHSIKTKIGALDAPTQWADDSMTMPGIDYQKFSCRDTAPGACAPSAFGGGGAPGVLPPIDDPFIGDYVSKLSEFVDYYGAKYPFHQGDDTVAISLASDVVGSSQTCLRPSKNLFYRSGDLSLSPWKHGLSLGGKAVTAVSVSLVDVQTPVYSKGVGISLLSEGLAFDTTAPQPGDGTVFQEVQLTPGPYVVSWWDRAGAAGTAQYTVSAATQDGTTVGSGVYDAFVPSSTDDWSDRRKLAFTVKTAGTYRVSFGPGVGSDSGFAVLAVLKVHGFL
jgi:hypothetical protein